MSKKFITQEKIVISDLKLDQELSIEYAVIHKDKLIIAYADITQLEDCIYVDLLKYLHKKHKNYMVSYGIQKDNNLILTPLKLEKNEK